jgi:hypothetical protein
VSSKRRRPASPAKPKPQEAKPEEPQKKSRKRQIATTVAIPVAVAALGAVVSASILNISTNGVKATRALISPPAPKIAVLTMGQFDSPVADYGPDGPVWAAPFSDVPRDLSFVEAAKHGAIDANSSLVRLNLRGSGPERITVQKVRVVVSARNRPLRGVFFPAERGGNAELRFMRADLDTGKIVWVNEALEPVPPKAIFVTDREEENIDLVAVTDSCDCRWHLELTYTADGKTGTSVVRAPGGKDFRTTSTRRSARR